MPLTEAEQVQDSLDANNAGASVVHIHRSSAYNHAITYGNPDE